MFSFLKKIFKRLFGCRCTECNCCKHQPINKIYTRCGFDIIVPQNIAKELDDENYCISVTKHNNKPSCVQLFKTILGKSTYCGTLKAYMKVKSFKDKNVCNFSYDNIVVKE